MVDKKAIDSLDALVRVVRGEVDPSDNKGAIVAAWFDADPARYVAAVLASPLGSHAEQYAVYQHLSIDRRVVLYRQALAACAAEGLRGLTAGSFMLGRFICTPHPVAFWNRLDDSEVAALLDEWALHASYLKVLGQVGERRISRARSLIADQGLPPIEVSQGDALVFMSLKLSARVLLKVAAEVDGEATRQLLAILQRPYSAFYDFSAPWSLGILRRICDDAAIALPSPDEE